VIVIFVVIVLAFVFNGGVAAVNDGSVIGCLPETENDREPKAEA
jgi:hypothetical protein